MRWSLGQLNRTRLVDIGIGIGLAGVVIGLALAFAPRPASCRIFTPHDLRTDQPIGFHLSPGQRFVVAEGDPNWSVDIREPAVLERTSCPGAPGIAFRAKRPGSTGVIAVGPSPRCISPNCRPPSFTITAIVDNPAYRFDTAVPSSQFTWGDPTYIKAGTTFELVFPAQYPYMSWENLSITDGSILTRVDGQSPAGRGLAILHARQPGETYVTALAQEDCHANNINCYGLPGDWRFLSMDFRVTASGDGLDATLTDFDNGRHLQLTVGQTVGIRLTAVAGEVSPELWPDPYQPVMLYPTGVRMDDRGESIQMAFRAVSTGQEQIVKRCNNACLKDFKVSLTIVPDADGIAAIITNLNAGNLFEVPRGSLVTVTLRPEIGPWNTVTSSDVWVLQPVSGRAVGAPAGALSWTFVARSGGESLIQAQSSCPRERRCQYEVMQVRVAVLPAG
jgi:hypothetical protein